jgi:hypothetical protein
MGDYRDGVQAEEIQSDARSGLPLGATLERWRAAVGAAPAFDRSSPVPMWIGLGLIGAGFVVLAYGWGQVAGLASVALQIPYLISAGCTGLGLIVLGAVLVAIQAQRRDAAAREETLHQLGRVLREIEALTSPRPDNDEQ